jgi:hypothetical protein
MKRFFFWMIIGALVVLSLPTEEAMAIPAFARKYKFSCSTCHSAIPKLKPYGEEFAGNGFRLPEAAEPKRAYQNTGDEKLMLIKDLPLAIRFDLYVQSADREAGNFDVQAPYGVKLLSGSPISSHVSYYFYFYISERGEVVGLEDAFFYFNDIGNVPFDLAVGQFQVCDPLFKRELRLTFEDYVIYKVQPGNSRANLTYDRGLMGIYGFDFGLDLTAMVLNGNGIKPADEDTKVFDNDNNKNFAFRASQSLGMVRLGAFAYSGKETVTNEENTISIYGPDLTIGNENIELNAQYMIREDDNPFFLANGAEKIETKGGFAELIYMPNGSNSLFIFSLLYNKVTGTNDWYDYESATFSISHMAARNIRVIGEGTYDLVNEKPVITLGIVSAF